LLPFNGCGRHAAQFLYTLDSLTAPTSATDAAFTFGVDALGDHGNAHVTVDVSSSTTGFTAVGQPGGHCVSAWQIWVHPTYGFRTEATPSLYCWTKETHDRYGKCTFHTSLNAAAYSSTHDESRSLSGLDDGTNTFSVYATDMYGNSEPGLASSFSWTVDTSAPTVSLHQAAALVTQTSRAFTWEAGESSSLFYKYQIDDGVTSFTTEESMAFAVGSFPVSSCSGSSHSFAVAAIDSVGNVGSFQVGASCMPHQVFPPTPRIQSPFAMSHPSDALQRTTQRNGQFSAKDPLKDSAFLGRNTAPTSTAARRTSQ
jgi:hypothetical protein